MADKSAYFSPHLVAVDSPSGLFLNNGMLQGMGRQALLSPHSQGCDDRHFRQSQTWAPAGKCVLTPHTGEFARLFPDLPEQLKSDTLTASKPQILRQAALRMNTVVMLKGRDTVIASPAGQVAIHSAPSIPWLATAGSGDVLSALITGLLARHLPTFDAACLGFPIHAAARHHGPRSDSG